MQTIFCCMLFDKVNTPHTHTHTTHTRTHTCTHACTHARMHTHTHTHTTIKMKSECKKAVPLVTKQPSDCSVSLRPIKSCGHRWHEVHFIHNLFLCLLSDWLPEILWPHRICLRCVGWYRAWRTCRQKWWQHWRNLLLQVPQQLWSVEQENMDIIRTFLTM